jgi:hypothetical protein
MKKILDSYQGKVRELMSRVDDLENENRILKRKLYQKENKRD